MATTRKDLEATLERIKGSARALGYNNVDGWYLYCAYGNKYWLYETVNGSGGVSGLFVADGFLGTGTGKAQDRLWTIARTLEDILYRIDPNTRPENRLARVSRYEGP